MALTNKDASIVLGMIARKDKQHDIAAWFGENQARIVEVEKGSHGSIAMAPPENLPPKGAPGPKGRRLRGYAGRALAAIETGNFEDAKKLLQDGIATFDKHEA